MSGDLLDAQDAFGFMADQPPTGGEAVNAGHDPASTAAEVAYAEAIIERHLRHSGVRQTRGTYSTSSACKRFVQVKIGNAERELFAVMFLDTRHRLIAFDVLFQGSVDRAMVYPREVIKSSLKHNASAIILAHNHPSGTPEPSASDIQVTSRISMLCQEIDVRLIDHIVVAGPDHISFAERGLL